MARIELRYCKIKFRDGLGMPGVDGVTPPTAQVITTPPTLGATSLTLGSVNIPRAKQTQKVPVGARFTLASEAGTPVHIVTARTQASSGGANAKQSVKLDNTVGEAPTGGTFTLASGSAVTAGIAYDAAASDVKTALIAMDDGYVSTDWDVAGTAGNWVVEFKGAQGKMPKALLVGDGTSLTGGGGLVKDITVATTQLGVPANVEVTTAITFSPALVGATTSYATSDVLTFQSQELEIKVGEGNLSYVEKKDYKYDLDRGNLDAVREGNEVPLDMKFECVYEHITTGTSEKMSPMDALKGKGAAAEWVTSGPDPCEPYSVDVEVEYTPPCSGADQELTLFPDFRADQKDIDFAKAMISVNGKCNAVEPIVTRVAQ